MTLIWSWALDQQWERKMWCRFDASSRRSSAVWPLLCMTRGSVFDCWYERYMKKKTTAKLCAHNAKKKVTTRREGARRGSGDHEP